MSADETGMDDDAELIDFRCKVCGKECDIAPADNSGAICPEHCEDHEFEYEPGEGHRCKHCNAEPPHDWYQEPEPPLHQEKEG